MIRRILVPLDGSAMAASVLPTVQTIAGFTGARLTLLTVVPPDAPDAAAPAAHAGLAEAARQLGMAGCVAEPLVTRGAAAEQIVRLAETHDLIALATRARAGLGRLAAGSVADTVVRAAPAPVLLVRAAVAASTPPDPPRRILVPLDGSSAAEAALPLATELARRAGATLLLVRSTDMARTAERGLLRDLATRTAQQAAQAAGDYLAQFAARDPLAAVPVQFDIRHEPPADAILASASAGRADLIVMGTHGRGGLGRWLLGSVADAVVRAAPVPVLLVRPGPAEAAAAAAAGIGTAAVPWPDHLPVRQIMTQPVVTVEEDATLETVARTMLARGIGCLPVVDAQGRLCGIITAADVAGVEGGLPFAAYRAPHQLGAWLPAQGLEAIYAQGRRLCARDIMTMPVHTLTEDDSVTAAAVMMVRHAVTHLPVVRDGLPVGIVARHDLLKLLVRPAGGAD